MMMMMMIGVGGLVWHTGVGPPPHPTASDSDGLASSRSQLSIETHLVRVLFTTIVLDWLEIDSMVLRVVQVED